MTFFVKNMRQIKKRKKNVTFTLFCVIVDIFLLVTFFELKKNSKKISDIFS
jgi:regulatory protein YycI of two-component signal transduction system YycFG